jgi:hypothetical protein
MPTMTVQPFGSTKIVPGAIFGGATLSTIDDITLQAVGACGVIHRLRAVGERSPTHPAALRKVASLKTGQGAHD